MLELVTELDIYAIHNRGVANQERILIRATESIDNLAHYGILVCENIRGNLHPVNDEFFWFGSGQILTNSWIFVNTGPGTATTSINENNSSEIVYSIHWGRKTTIFANPQYEPMLIRMGGVARMPVSQDVHQNGLIENQ